MADLPSWFLPRPPMPLNVETRAAFDTLYEQLKVSGGSLGRYDLAAPLWQFLCYIADTKDVLLHGSGDPAISIFEPRKSNDVHAFGDQQAVYASSDGLWPMYFAVIDRSRIPLICNSSARVRSAAGELGDPFYFFSVSAPALAERPFRPGTIYLLPRATFQQQPAEPHPKGELLVAQWASLVPVKPLARLTVAPEDFPLLDAIRGHDDETLLARAKANPAGFPWVD